MKTNHFFYVIFAPLFLAVLIFTLLSSCKEQDITEHSDHTEAIGLIIYYKEQPFFKVLNGKIDSTISTSLVFKRGVNYSPLEVRFIDSDGEIIIPDEEGKNFFLGNC